MGFKKITYSLPALKTLLESKHSCVYCIEKCRRSLTVLPADLANLKNSVNEYLSAKVTTCDSELKGIILSHKNIKIIDSVELNDDCNYRLDYIADIYIFKPEVGSLLSGVVNKKSSDHVGVLVHSVFNASIPRPRANENGCPKMWVGSNVKIGQQVTFEVARINFSARLPYIKGKLIDIDHDKFNEDGDSGIGGHESTEEGSAYKKSFEKPTVFVENVKKKKKKKRLSFGEFLPSEPLEENESPSTSFSLPGGKNSSHLSEIESLLLNEVIATVNGSEIHHSRKEKNDERSPQKESTSGLSSSVEGTKKRKRTSSINTENTLNDHTSSLLNFSNADEHPKVKKKKLSKDKSNEPTLLLQEIEDPEREVKKKKKKSMDNSNNTDKVFGNNLSGTDVQSTIENLLSFAAGSIKHKKKKKKLSGVLSNEVEILTESNEPDLSSLSEKQKAHKKHNNSGELADLETKDPISGTVLRLSDSADDITSLHKEERRKKKRKSSMGQCEDSSTINSETEFHILESSISDSSHKKHKKKDKKKKSLSHDMEFLQMENNCIAELLSSVQSRVTNEQINDSPIEKKKKKRSME